MFPSTLLPTPVSRLYQRALYGRETRLALIHNGKWHDPISCSFEYIEIKNPATQSYSALSYVWGSSRAAETIQINGHDHNISVNLACAIRHIRDENNLVLIWVDAICIDQDNVAERSTQVAMMQDIYASAQRVIVFLGDGSYYRIPRDYAEKEPLAPVTFSTPDQDAYLVSQFHNSWETMCRRPEWYSFCTISVIRALSDVNSYKDTIRCIADGKESSRLKLFELIRQFINIQWWQRVWVVQEATVPPEILIQYGNVKVPWEILANAANTCENLDWDTNTPGSNLFLGIEREHAKILLVLSNRIQEMERIRWDWNANNKKGTGLVSLLQKFSSRKASDDRDKVFALLGLASDIKTIKPNYSLSTVEVYRRTVIELVKHSGSLAALSGDMKRKNSRGIPTWIPDWSVAMEEPDRRRMQLEGMYTTNPRWRIVLIDREHKYWEHVAMNMRSLHQEIETRKRRPLTKEIIHGLIRYDRILSTKTYGSEMMHSDTLDEPQQQVIDLCKAMYGGLEDGGPIFWSSTPIWKFIGAHLSLPPTPSSGELYRLDIIRCCSKIFCARALDLWVEKLQHIERERYNTNRLFMSDQEREEVVARNHWYPSDHAIINGDISSTWKAEMHLATRRMFQIMERYMPKKTLANNQLVESTMEERLRSLASEATIAVEEEPSSTYSMTFDNPQGTLSQRGLLNELSDLIRLATEVLNLWTNPDTLRAVEQAKHACKDLINLHQDNVKPADHASSGLLSTSVVFIGSTAWMRHLRAPNPRMSFLSDGQFLEFRRQKQRDSFEERSNILGISSKVIATVNECSERLLTWADSASRFFTISQWALCAQNLKRSDFATLFVRTVVGDIYEDTHGDFFRLERPEEKELLRGWFISSLLPQLCDMNPAIDSELWKRCLNSEVETEDNDISFNGEKSFDAEMRITTEGRVFFTTTDGRMGLGPGSMTTGDEIHILPGGSSPFVLRPVGKIENMIESSFEVIGDCLFLVHSEEKHEEEDDSLQGCLPVEILGELLPKDSTTNDIILS